MIRLYHLYEGLHLMEIQFCDESIEILDLEWLITSSFGILHGDEIRHSSLDIMTQGIEFLTFFPRYLHRYGGEQPSSRISFFTRGS